MDLKKTCRNCIYFGYTNDHEATVCYSGAGLKLPEEPICIYFEEIDNETAMK